jgi:glycosyltransferase involved in cell wall biosynthesis
VAPDLSVHIVPDFRRPDKGDGGIRRVVEAQRRYLPRFGIRLVETAEEAQVLAGHGTAIITRNGVPNVNHNHGLYWANYEWGGEWAQETNRQVVEAMSVSVAHTAPSRWVSDAIRRGMLAYPEVVYHGVEASEWQVQPQAQPYVLWNKARTDAASTPVYLNELARRMPKQWFVSTFGDRLPNVRLVGKVPHNEMKSLVENAAVYLATTRETFGIGTIEALAAGVPVAGWHWGGQSEIIVQGETGYLAPHGDYTALADCIRRCISEQKRLSPNCRQDAIDRWAWHDRIRQYADMYKRVAASWYAPRPKVSVIVTCFNLAQYLVACIDSVRAQSLDDIELLLVDDCSADDTAKLGDRLQASDKRIRYLSTPENLGLSGARNFGFAHSRGHYVMFLDADDMLAENALATLASELDRSPAIHVAGGHLTMVDEHGKDPRRNDWPWKEFDWWSQMAHANQLHYASLMRRQVLEASGGYRRRDWRAEDAALLCRVTSLGFRAAKVTEQPTIIYRNRGDSKSKSEPGDGPWTEWFPWNMGLRYTLEGARVARNRRHHAPELVPFGAQGPPPLGWRFWNVEDHTEPKVSVVIPVGPGHERYVIDALDSLVAQSYPFWEAIVVNDTGRAWAAGFDSPLAGAPYARVLATEGQRGPAVARNLGARYARAPALLFLDADDWLAPAALERMLEVFMATPDALVYTDILEAYADPREPMKVYNTKDFQCGAVLEQMQHSSQYLFPTAKHQEVGGFDEEIVGWEDWDHLIALQASGLCGYRVPEPLFFYRKHTGRVRDAAWERREEITDYLRRKWAPYYQGRKDMPCPGGCGGKRKTSIAKTSSMAAHSANGGALLMSNGNAVQLIYQGPGGKRVLVRGPATNTIYRFKTGEPRYVDVADAEVLLERARGDGRHDFLVHAEAKPAPVVAPAPVPAPAAHFQAPASMPSTGGFDAGGILDKTSVPQMRARIAGDTYDLGELQELFASETAGKGRKTMLRILSDAIDQITRASG